MIDCEHQWLRLPIVDLTVSHYCTECSHCVQICFNEKIADMTLDEISQGFVRHYGGTFTGEGYIDSSSFRGSYPSVTSPEERENF